MKGLLHPKGMTKIRRDKKIKTYKYLAHKRAMAFLHGLCLKRRPANVNGIASGEIRKAVVISLDYIGDYILRTIPAVHLLKKNFPDASITVMTGSWTKDLVTVNPLVSDVITYNAGWLDRSDKRWSLSKRFRVLRDVYNAKFDLMLDVRGSIGTALLEILAPAKHILDAESLRIDEEKTRLISIEDKDRESVKRMLGEGGIDFAKRLISIHPSVHSPAKMWDSANWAGLCDRLIERYDAEVAICGAGEDVIFTNDIIRRMKKKVKNFAGRTSLRELTALIDISALCITIDSGPMHIAGSLNIPVVALFGPNNPETCKPRSEKCRPVFKHLPCTESCIENAMDCDNKCMKTISVEDVLKEVEDVFSAI